MISQDTGARMREEGASPWTAAASFRKAASALADLIVPPLCLSCHRPLGSHDALCSECWRRIDFIRPPLCDRLGLPMPYDTGGPMVSAAAIANPPDYDRARAVARFDGVMRELVHGLKFRDRLDSRRLFGQWMVEAGAELLEDADVIVPVPLTAGRLLSRRFNQSALLAQEVSRRSGVAFAPTTLLRTRRTIPQVGLSRQQRRKNVSGAFAVAGTQARRIEDANVVLVDDVITTGATVGACSRTLRRVGAARVDVLALALVTDEAWVST